MPLTPGSNSVGGPVHVQHGNQSPAAQKPTGNFANKTVKSVKGEKHLPGNAKPAKQSEPQPQRKIETVPRINTDNASKEWDQHGWVSGSAEDNEKLESLLANRLGESAAPGKQGTDSNSGPDEVLPARSSQSLTTDQSEPEFFVQSASEEPDFLVQGSTQAKEKESIEQLGNKDQKENKIKSGLASKLAFLNSIPHKKDILFVALGIACCVGAVASMPIGFAVFYPLGAILLNEVVAGALFGSDDSPAVAPPSNTEPEKEKKSEDKDKKSESAQSSDSPDNKGEFLAAENADFKKADEAIDSGEEARRKLLEAQKNNGNLTNNEANETSKVIQQLEDELRNTSSGQPLADRVASILAPVMSKAGFDDKPESWAAVDQMVDAAKKALSSMGTTDDQLFDDMYAATKVVLDSLKNLNDVVLDEMRNKIAALMSAPGLSQSTVKLLQAQINAIDERLAELHLDKASGSRPAEWNDDDDDEDVNGVQHFGPNSVSAQTIENASNRMYYTLLKHELTSLIGQELEPGEPFSTFKQNHANSILNVAYNLLNTDQAWSSKAFADELRKEDGWSRFAKEGVNKILSKQRAFRT